MGKEAQSRAHQGGVGSICFEVRWPGPLDVSRSLDIFRYWGDDRLDRWDSRVLLRTTRIGVDTVPYACIVCGTVDAPAVEVLVENHRHRAAVEQVVRSMFVTAPESLQLLSQTDATVARLAQRYRGVRPVLQADLFTALIRSISAQQVNLKWAVTTRQRLAEAFGRRHTVGAYEVYSLHADDLAPLDPAALRALQFTTRKAEYIVALARAVAGRLLDLEALRLCSDAEVIARLTALRGIGRWTAEWFLARALGRPCVAAGDLGVRKAIAAVYLHGRLPSESEVRELTAHWGPAAGVVQQLILHALRDAM